MEPTRGERPPHASFIRAHAESVPHTRASFAHTRRVSPARELHSRTRGERPPHASSIRAHAKGLLALRAILSLLSQYIFATLDAKIIFRVQATPLLDAKIIFHVQAPLFWTRKASSASKSFLFWTRERRSASTPMV